MQSYKNEVLYKDRLFNLLMTVKVQVGFINMASMIDVHQKEYELFINIDKLAGINPPDKIFDVIHKINP